MSRLIVLLLTASLLGSQGCAWHKAPGDPTTIPAARLQQIVRADRERLAGVDSPRHLAHTYLGVDVTDEGFFSAIGHVVTAIPYHLYLYATGVTPVKAVVAMENSTSPDLRRTGIAELANYRFGRKPPYTRRYDQIATEPPTDYTVRAEAIRALNYSRSHLGDATFLSNLDDAQPHLRLEAAKALANLPNEKAVSKLIARLQSDEEKDVRIACADALRNYKTLDAARALTNVLNDRDFGVAWQARQSLQLMTGHDYRYDEAAWLGYLSQAKTPFI